MRMEGTPAIVSLEDMLSARDRRAIRQEEMRREYGTALLSITLNIPGAVKIFAGSSALLKMAVDSITEKCTANQYAILEERTLFPATGPEALLAVAADAVRLKELAVEAEEGASYSRLFDIDVIDAEGRHIGRSDLGFSPRQCFCCDKPAVECVRAKTHDSAEIAKRMEFFLQQFHARQTDLRPPALWKMGSAALEAALLEAACTPAPGLVDRANAGAHQDMDYFTFLYGSAALAPFFTRCAAAGWFHTGPQEELLPVLRMIGLRGEKDMLLATSGVNTQRGLLFLLGILLGGAALLASRGEALASENQLAAAAAVCRGIVRRELEPLRERPAARRTTAGERLFLQYGETGIRGEIEAGLPGVARAGLPCLRAALSKGLSVNDALVHALIGLMRVTQDTTVLNRCGPEGLSLMKAMAEEAYGLGGMLTEAGKKSIQQMDAVFIRKNISPGGTADLLAATWFVHRMESLPL